METRAARKRANSSSNAEPIVLNNKKQRVVLGELPDLNCSENVQFSNEKFQSWKNPKRGVCLFENFKSDKPIFGNKKAEFVDEQIGEPYASDISKYLRSMEKKRRPMVGYIDKVQRGVTSNMRGILIDWLVEVADEYKLLPETLHLSVSYIDRFLSLNVINRSNLQLLGVSSMLIASKYEEITPPKAVDFRQITDNTYQLKQVIKMEADILKSLNFEMGNPHVYTFLKEFIGFATENQKTSKLQMEFLCNYLAELSLLEYECIRFLPSVVAASVIFLARFIIRPDVYPWTSSLSDNLGYKSDELEECVLILHDLYLSRKAASLKAVREKYKQHKFKSVANLPVPPEVPNHYFEEE
ncbi:cyclin [Trifolium repens]|nr:putative cyclin-A3-1 [Trifolium repens]WJX35256.1 cyclin [Trifolium repens]